MLVHRRVTPSIKFAGTHLYTWVERGTVRVKRLAQELYTMSPARARTRTARSGVEPPLLAHSESIAVYLNSRYVQCYCTMSTSHVSGEHINNWSSRHESQCFAIAENNNYCIARSLSLSSLLNRSLTAQESAVLFFTQECGNNYTGVEKKKDLTKPKSGALGPLD